MAESVGRWGGKMAEEVEEVRGGPGGGEKKSDILKIRSMCRGGLDRLRVRREGYKVEVGGVG